MGLYIRTFRATSQTPPLPKFCTTWVSMKVYIFYPNKKYSNNSQIERLKFIKAFPHFRLTLYTIYHLWWIHGMTIDFLYNISKHWGFENPELHSIYWCNVRPCTCPLVFLISRLIIALITKYIFVTNNLGNLCIPNNLIHWNLIWSTA